VNSNPAPVAAAAAAWACCILAWTLRGRQCAPAHGTVHPVGSSVLWFLDEDVHERVDNRAGRRQRCVGRGDPGQWLMTGMASGRQVDTPVGGPAIVAAYVGIAHVPPGEQVQNLAARTVVRSGEQRPTVRWPRN